MRSSRRSVSLNAQVDDGDVATFHSLITASDTHPHAQLHICADCMRRRDQALQIARNALGRTQALDIRNKTKDAQDLITAIGTEHAGAAME